MHWLNEEMPARKVLKESDLGRTSKPTRNQVHNFCDHEVRYDQRSRMSLQQLKAGCMMTIVGVHVRVERAGIHQQRYRPGSSLRISSICSEMSSRPLRPAPAAMSFLR